MEKSPRFAHIYFGGGRITVAYERVDDPVEDGKGPRIYRAAPAYCSPKDQFVKRRGRLIAANRLSSNSRFNFMFTVHTEEYVADKIFDWFIDNTVTETPKWVEKTASIFRPQVPYWNALLDGLSGEG